MSSGWTTSRTEKSGAASSKNQFRAATSYSLSSTSITLSPLTSAQVALREWCANIVRRWCCELSQSGRRLGGFFLMGLYKFGRNWGPKFYTVFYCAAMDFEWRAVGWLELSLELPSATMILAQALCYIYHTCIYIEYAGSQSSACLFVAGESGMRASEECTFE